MTTVRSYNKRWEQLKSERSTFIPLYQSLSDYHLAHRGRFLVSDRNKGHNRNVNQINNTSRLAARTLASGMMSGITSPARPWFRLSSGDAGLDDSVSVKQWLHDVQGILYKVFSHSNTYNALHQLYSELGVFGTASMGVYEDFNNVIWCKPYTVGSYCLALGANDVVDTHYREYELSIGQVVKTFGLENCSTAVQDQWMRGNTEAWTPIIHLIEPNDDRDNCSPMARDKRFRSVYYEARQKSGDTEKFLMRSGFDSFPILAPRWDVTGEDVYATDCPGITALGDTKTLQLGERRFYQALDKVVDPPLQGPSTMKTKLQNNAVSAGDVIWHDSTSEGLRSIYQFSPDLGALKQINMDAEQRIRRAFYEDLFLMLANTDRRQITAREVAEKHEEKLLMLGPVLERLHTELLDPLIDRTFSILQRNGVLPPPPPELQDRELSVEYVSVLAQAQRLVSTGGIERLSQFAASLATVWPEARFKVKATQAIDDYAEALGVNPAMIASDDDVVAAQQAEQAQMAQATAMQQAAGMVDAAKTASETQVTDDNMLGAVMQRAGIG